MPGPSEDVPRWQPPARETQHRADPWDPSADVPRWDPDADVPRQPPAAHGAVVHYRPTARLNKRTEQDPWNNTINGMRRIQQPPEISDRISLSNNQARSDPHQTQQRENSSLNL